MAIFLCLKAISRKTSLYTLCLRIGLKGLLGDPLYLPISREGAIFASIVPLRKNTTALKSPARRAKERTISLNLGLGRTAN